MLDASINATATLESIVQFLGNSFTEQVSNYMAENETPREKEVPIGWPIGASLGSLLVVGVAVWLSIYVVHQRRRNRLQQVSFIDNSLAVCLTCVVTRWSHCQRLNMCNTSLQSNSCVFVCVPCDCAQDVTVPRKS